jgi:CubicO group peptidase (beta-lactamase class C family)
MKKSILFLFFLALISTQYNWQNVQDRINYYIANGAFPGGVLRISNTTHTIYENSFGSFTHNVQPFGSPSFQNDTIFDIASLTKVSATLSCIMHLYDLGKISTEDTVGKFIPEYNNNGK